MPFRSAADEQKKKKASRTTGMPIVSSNSDSPRLSVIESSATVCARTLFNTWPSTFGRQHFVGASSSSRPLAPTGDAVLHGAPRDTCRPLRGLLLRFLRFRTVRSRAAARRSELRCAEGSPRR